MICIGLYANTKMRGLISTSNYLALSTTTFHTTLKSTSNPAGMEQFRDFILFNWSS